MCIQNVVTCILVSVGMGMTVVAEGEETRVIEKNGAAIQRAIDEVAASGGGRVVLEKGVYETGTLYLRSGVELHLAKDAILRGGDRPECYDDVDEPRIGKVPEFTKKALIVCLDGTNVAVTGEGVIDCQGPKFYDTEHLRGRHYVRPKIERPRMVEFFNCSNIRFEGVTFKDSPNWTFWLRMCTDIAVSHIRIVGDQKMENNDGIDFDGCRRIRVGDSYFETGDDCLILRAIQSRNGDSSLCEDVVVSNCVLNSAYQGVRLGCPSDGLIRNAVFRNIKFIGYNGIQSFHPYYYMQQGSKGSCSLSNIVFESCDFDVRNTAINFYAQPGVRLGDFGNVTFRNVSIKGSTPLLFRGTRESPLRNIVLENVRIEIVSCGVLHDTGLAYSEPTVPVSQRKKPFPINKTPFVIEGVENFTTRDVTVTISGLPGSPFEGKGSYNCWENVP